MTRALVLHPLEERYRERLREAWPHSIGFTVAQTQEAVDELADDELEVILGDFVPRDRGRVPSLRWLQYTGAGIDALLERAPWRDGITVTTASGVNALAIGEYVLGAMSLVAGRWRERLEASRRRSWVMADERLAATSLRGRTIGVVGYGSVGREAARLAAAAGMIVLACKRDPMERHDRGYVMPGTGDPEGRIPERWYGMDGVAEVAQSSDFLLLSAPLTDRTRGLVDASVLAALPEGAWLVNVARGALVDESALVGALSAGRLGGAILDVASEEPLPPTSPLWSSPNTIVTPHVAAWSPGLWSGLIDLFSENLARFARREKLLNLVDPVTGY